MTSFRVGDRVRYIGYDSFSRKTWGSSEGEIVALLSESRPLVTWDTGRLARDLGPRVEMNQTVIEVIFQVPVIQEPSEDIYNDLI